MAGQKRKPRPSAFRSHRLDIYDADIYLATTKPQWRALARRIGALDTAAPEAAGQCTFATFHPNNGGLVTPVIVFWINVAQHRDQAQLVDTLAHEASHAAGRILDHIAHQVREGTDEPHAYLVGWLTRWLWDHVEWTAPLT